MAAGGATLRVVGAVYAVDGGTYLLGLPIEGGLNCRRRPIAGQEGVIEFVLGIEGFDLPASCAGAYCMVSDDGSDTLCGSLDDVPFLRPEFAELVLHCFPCGTRQGCRVFTFKSLEDSLDLVTHGIASGEHVIAFPDTEFPVVGFAGFVPEMDRSRHGIPEVYPHHNVV